MMWERAKVRAEAVDSPKAQRPMCCCQHDLHVSLKSLTHVGVLSVQLLAQLKPQWSAVVGACY